MSPWLNGTPPFSAGSSSPWCRGQHIAALITKDVDDEPGRAGPAEGQRQPGGGHRGGPRPQPGQARAQGGEHRSQAEPDQAAAEPPTLAPTWEEMDACVYAATGWQQKLAIFL